MSGPASVEHLSALTGEATIEMSVGGSGSRRIVARLHYWNSSISFDVKDGADVVLSTRYLGEAVRRYNEIASE